MAPPEDPRFRQPPARPQSARRRAARPAPAAAVAVDADAGERLEKVLANAGVASRRDCELAIRAGRIRVNGRPVRELPCLVRAGKDLVEIDGVIVDTSRRATAARADYLYFAVNKPKGVISTAHDPEGRASIVALVAGLLPRGRRVYPVGRLDADSTGLILLTDDGELTHRLTHPRYGLGKEYRVTAEGALDAAALEQLRRGVYLAGPDAIARSKGQGRGGGARRAAFDDLRVIKSTRDRNRGGVTLLSVTLREGQNREIRRLLARVGLKVRRLERVTIGPVRLGPLKPGAVRRLGPGEVAALRQATGLEPASGAPLKGPASAAGTARSRPGR